jgi:hypothetical protein
VVVTVFLCYAREDRHMVRRLKEHLSWQERRGVITLCDDGDIGAGVERESEINKRLEEAQVILLLISASFLASDYCWRVGIRDAIKRHEGKHARVIPVILRDVAWDGPPLDKLQSLPDGVKPITSWKPPDKGYKNVADGVVKVVEQWNAHTLPEPVEERRTLKADFERLIETVKGQMLPPGRGMTTASTLQQLSIFIPNGVTLADLMVGWEALSHAAGQGEEPTIVSRRVTCGELAGMAAQIVAGQGSLEQAVKTWQVWVKAFEKSGDPRQAAMAKTFARELAELEEVSTRLM